MSEDKGSGAPQRQGGPSIWQIAGPLGAAVCSAVAAYEAFHMRTAFGWAAGAAVCMLLGRIGARRQENVESTDPVEAPEVLPEVQASGVPAATSLWYRKKANLFAAAFVVIALVLFVSFWTGARSPVTRLRGAPVAPSLVIDAVLTRNPDAVREALADWGEREAPSVPAAALEGHLSAAQIRKLRMHEPSYSLLAVALAGSDLPTAALLLRHKHLFKPEDRYLLASALAQADEAERERWRGLMVELSEYRDRRIKALAERSDVDSIVVAGLLRRQPNFQAKFVESDADRALEFCDAAALDFILAQDAQQGRTWQLGIGGVFSRLLEKDLATLAPGESSTSDLTDLEAQSCFAAARSLLRQSAYPVGSLPMYYRIEDIGRVMNAADSRIIASLRAGAGLGDFDDADFDLPRTRRFLEQNPPYYPYSLRFLAMSMERTVVPNHLQMVFDRPMLHSFHQAFQQDARQALRIWSASAAGERERIELREFLNYREDSHERLAMVYSGKAQAQQVETLRQWLADAGLSCRLRVKRDARGFPGTAWLRYGCQ